MEHEKQVQNVKKALELETHAEALRKSLHAEQEKCFGKPAPNPPTKKTAEFTPPPIRHGCKLNWLMMLLPAAIDIALSMITQSVLLTMLIFATLFVWPPVYYFVLYRKEKKEAIEKVRNSDEYQREYAAAKAEADNKQKLYDIEYAAAKDEFENVTMPKYQAEYAEWESEKKKKVKQIDEELSEVHKELTELYEQTRIVPIQYRSIYALQYIYDMISTSDYDVRQAIDSFDKNEQRRLDIMRLQEQQQANALAMEQNDLLDRQNTIAAKARRDANIAAVVGTVQRHNTNKTIKKWLDK